MFKDAIIILVRWIKKFFIRIARVFVRSRIHGAVNIDDPLGGALTDSELLMAFSAQSHRQIPTEKIKSLNASRRQIIESLASGSAPNAEVETQFWIAYGALASEMAPLSAHSIRSSMQVNCQRFPRSLFTPTGHNALFAAGIFFICICLQGFWVAGSELISRADAVEKRRSELLEKMVSSSGSFKRAHFKMQAISDKICLDFPNYDECQDIDTAEAGSQRKNGTLRLIDNVRLASLQAELKVARDDHAERKFVDAELRESLEKMTEESRPLETLLERWHERAQNICDSWIIRYLCPVEKAQRNDAALQKLSAEIEEIKRKVKSDSQAFNSYRDNRRLAYQKLDAEQYFTMKMSLDRSNFDLNQKTLELARLRADRFRSIVVEVRIIIGNLGTYVIAMVMGILGALAFILRTMSFQLRDHTYIPLSASISVIRISLGAIAGVFGSLLAPGDVTLKILPPLLIPFIFGYGIEILFSILDKTVKAFTQAKEV